MKLDKDSFGKNQFWVLLGLAGALLVATIGLLFFGPAANARKARKQYDDELKSLTDVKNPKNEKFRLPWDERQKEFLKEKVKLWDEAWKTQADVMVWPVAPNANAEVKDRWNRLSQKAAFGDAIPDLDRVDYRDTHYDAQFNRQAFLAPHGGMVSFPIDFDEERIYNKVPWRTPRTNPTTEELWLAQEDVWVRREMLRVLQAALESAGRFREVREKLWESSVAALAGGPADAALVRRLGNKVYKVREAKAPAVLSRLFRNQNWEVELLLEPEKAGSARLQVSAESTIKNINPARRPLPLVTLGQTRPGLLFRVSQEGRDPKLLNRVQGELLAWGATSKFRVATPASGIDFTKDIVFEEVYDPATSPIKRIEDLRVGPDALSHRHAVAYDLVPGKVSAEAIKKIEEEAAASGATDGASSPMAPPMPGGMGGMGPPAPLGPSPDGGGRGMGGGTASKDYTEHGIPRNRYVLANEQVRRIPVAMVVVVDQAYRNEILTALANSRMRIQTVQLHWRHREPLLTNPNGLPDFVPPDVSVDPEGGGPAPPPPMNVGRTAGGTGGGVPPMPTRPPMPGSRPGGMPPGFPGFPGFPGIPGMEGFTDPANDLASVESSRNLIELTFYGTAALFERYDPNAPKTEGTDTQPKP